jgi:hypothetical protein
LQSSGTVQGYSPNMVHIDVLMDFKQIGFFIKMGAESLVQGG